MNEQDLIHLQHVHGGLSVTNEKLAEEYESKGYIRISESELEDVLTSPLSFAQWYFAKLKERETTKQPLDSTLAT